MTVFWQQKHAMLRHTCRKKASFYVRIKQHSDGMTELCRHNENIIVAYCKGIYGTAMRHVMIANYRQNVGMRDSTFTAVLRQ